MKTEPLRLKAFAGRRLLRASLLTAAGALALLASTGAAWAAGGRDIAAAPGIAYGVQEFGNTATDSGTTSDGCSDSLRSWWMLPVSAGDWVTIDFEGGAYRIQAFPVGTTDFNLGDTDALFEDQLSANDQGEVTFAAPASGAMPLDFINDNCWDEPPYGPYDFTARVQHAVRLSLAPMSTLGLTGTVTIGARNPAGAPISDGSLDVALQVLDGQWVTVGHASPSAGVATITYTIPSVMVRRRMRVRAAAAGAAYLTATTPKQKVTLPPALHVRLPKQARVRRHGKLVVSASGYDGATLSDRALMVAVQLHTPRGWKRIGSRWVEDSRAPVRLHIPRRYVGRRVALRAIVGGDYPRQVSKKRRYSIR